MGAVLAKFRKEKTTIEILEKLEEEIKEIEHYTISTQAQQKRYVGNFLVISIGLYIICFLVFYFAFFPPTWMERVTYSLPLLIFPLFIFLLKHLVAWFFQRKLNKKSVKLSKLKNEKKKVLERVMDKETYKVALEILNKFGDKSNGFKGATQPSSIESSTPNKQVLQTPLQKPQQHSQNQVLIRRPSPGSQPQHQRSPMPNQAGNLLQAPPGGSMGYHSGGGMPAQSTPLSRLQTIQQRSSPMQMQQQRRRTPYPIVNPQQKGVMDKLVDYLIGDGIQNRFAMICTECYGHNGMALQEYYEYTSFRCIYCNALNPSKKARTSAPKLPITMTNPSFSQSSGVGHGRRKSSDSAKTSSSEKQSSGSESDEEPKRKIQLENLVREEEAVANPKHVEEIVETVNEVTNDEISQKPIIEKKED